MHRCSNSHGNMMGQCTCGLFHTPTNSFSMLFSMQAPNQTDICPFISSSSSSSSAVDCTLSLGTPSTRLSNENNNFNNNNGKGVAVQHERRSSYMPNFCWDILQPKHNPSPPPTHHNKSSRGGTHTTSISGSDPLLARRCANCDTTSTPLWRNGPRGPKSLCNACGIRFKKEERRATAAAATTTTSGGAAVAPGGIMESQHMINSNNSWVHHQYSQSTGQKIPCLSPSFGNEFRFMEDDDRDSETGIPPFLSWRLNVTDRPSLVHDFTR